MPGKWTVDQRGSQDVSIVTTGAEKCNFTVVLCVTADGGKCPPLIIFKRKTIPKNLPQGLIVKANEKGWMNEDLLCEWVHECWLRRNDPSDAVNQSLLIYDSARCHLTAGAKSTIQEHSKIAIIPGGLTKILQPLDVAINKSFKNRLRRKWEKWMVDEATHTYTAGGRMRRASYYGICSWILDSFNEVPQECVQNGFRRALEEGAPILQEPDHEETVELEQEEEILEEEGEEEAEIVAEALPEEFYNLFESFHFVSDENFNGF